MKKIIIILIIVSFMGCNKEKSIDVEKGKELKLSVSVSDGELRTSEFIQSADYFLLTGDDDNIIGEISKAIYFNNNLYILDSRYSKSLFVFNKNGELLNKIKKHYQEPGGFIEASDFDINKKERAIYLLDDYQKKIIKYDLAGNYQYTEIKYFPWGFCFGIVGENCIAISSNGIYNSKYPNDLHLLNNNGDIFIKCFNLKDKKHINFTTRTTFYYNKDSLLYKPNNSDTIYNITKDNIETHVIVDFGNNRAPWNKIGKESTNRRKISDILSEGEYAYHIDNYLENERYILFQFTYKTELKYLLYSKKTGKLLYGTNFINDYDELPFSGYKVLIGNQLLCIYPTYLCDLLKKDENKKLYRKLPKKLKILIQKSNRSTNGIVVDYTLRDI